MLKISKSKSNSKSNSKSKSKSNSKSKSKSNSKSKSKSKSNQIPKIGNKVKIAIKPYKGKSAIGKVKRVLTKKKYHSRGHKVMLNSDEIGRVIDILIPFME
jgi:small subunit ribosomal protein S1